MANKNSNYGFGYGGSGSDGFSFDSGFGGGGGFDDVRCSFCGKTQGMVRKLIAGPNVFICDECVQLCEEIIRHDFSQAEDDDVIEEEDKALLLDNLPTPAEIHRELSKYVIGQALARYGQAFGQAVSCRNR